MMIVNPEKYSLKRKIRSLLSKPQYLGILLLALTIPVTFYAVSQRQDIRQNAAETFGDMVLTSTFNSIGIEVKNTTAPFGALEFKKTTESSWRKGIDLSQTADTYLYGSALLLDPGTTYDVKVTYDGKTVQGQIATKAENIPTAEQLWNSTSADNKYYVRINGNDSNDGKSEATAWATMEKAMTSAPAGAVVQVGPGRYKQYAKTRTTPITLLAQYPALDDNQNLINTDKLSIVDTTYITAPTGSNQPNAGVWEQVTLTGFSTNQPRKIWRWKNTSAKIIDSFGPDGMSYTSDKDSMLLTRLARWDNETEEPIDDNGVKWTQKTPEGWVDVLYANTNYNYGWRYFSNADKTIDIYLRMPNDMNPNDLYIFAGPVRTHSSGSGSWSFSIDAPDSRISGFAAVHGQIKLGTNASNSIVDHNHLYRSTINFEGKSPSTYLKNLVIQHNKILDTSLWSMDPNVHVIPWNFIKTGVRLPSLYTTRWTRVGANAENHGAFGHGQNIVIRYNTIDGIFNGIGARNIGFDQFVSMNVDIHDNVFTNIPDDALEPENFAINWRIWNNRFINGAVFLSVGPVKYGPMYVFRNTGWGMSTAGERPSATGALGVGSLGFKYSNNHGSESSRPDIYVINNSFYGTGPYYGKNAKGGAPNAGGGGGTERFIMRNNIFRMASYAFETPGANTWDEDYNYFATTDPDRGINVRANNKQTVAEYREATGGGAHTNIDDTSQKFKTLPDAWWVDIAAGDLRLRDDAPLVNRGVHFPNIADNHDAKSAYVGSAPDLGAYESGATVGQPLPTAGGSTPVPSGVQSPTPTKVILASPTRTPTPTVKVTVPPQSTPTRTPTPQPSSSIEITRLVLMNTDSGQPIPGYENISGTININLASLPTRHLSVVAITTPSQVGSVVFFLNGKSHRVETRLPYALFGDSSNKLNPWRPTDNTTYTISATPYSTSNGTGTAGTSRSVTIQFGTAQTPTPTAGEGLVGSYFDNRDLTNLKVTRVDRIIDFGWGLSSPFSNIATDTFSVRWTGKIMPERSGTYTFYTQSDDGVRLWVNNQPLINDWNDHGVKENKATISLNAGQKYDIRLEYYDNRRTAAVKLLWSGPSVAKQVIPQKNMYSQ